MKTMVLIIMLMNGNVKHIPINNANLFADCDKQFTKLTYSKTVINNKNKQQQATFYKGSEVLLYSCIWQ